VIAELLGTLNKGAGEQGADALIQRLLGDKDAQHLLLDTLNSPIILELQCLDCDATHAYTVESAFVSPHCLVDPTAEPDPRRRLPPTTPPDWDGVMLNTIITCASCGAIDRYSVPSSSMAILFARLMMQTAAGQGPRQLDPSGLMLPNQDRVLLGIPQLWDGTVKGRPSLAVAHLRALAEASPDNGPPWRRLGNLHERLTNLPEACACWTRALEDPAEAIAAYSLAEHASRHGDAQVVFNHLVAAFERLPAAFRRADCRPNQNIIDAMIDLLWAIKPLLPPDMALSAIWTEGPFNVEPVLNASTVRISRITSPDTLVAFLLDVDLKSLTIAPESMDHGRTLLHERLNGSHNPNLPTTPRPSITPGKSAAQRKADKTAQRNARKKNRPKRKK